MFKLSKCLVKNAKNLYLKQNYHYQKWIYQNPQVNLKAILSSIREDINETNEKIVQQPNLYRFIEAYRRYGFLQSHINPLDGEKFDVSNELNPRTYGLADESTYSVDGLLHSNKESSISLEILEEHLKKVYSNHMTIELDHITSVEEKYWLAREYEQLLAEDTLAPSTQLQIAKLLLKSEIFDHFLALKFPTFKRYSLEGGESCMAFYESLFEECSTSEIEDVVMGIAHRGRLNLMVLMLNLSPQLFFTKIKGKSEYSSDVKVSGDISHHFPCSTDLTYNGRRIHASLLPNPSHLEAVDPVVLGKARSKQLHSNDGFYSSSYESKKVLTLLIHGDAAFAGQGIVEENFQLARLPNYSVGGTVHLITNNQIGFTATSNLGRSGNFNSDLAKGFECPILRVNGDYPELAYKAAKLAVKYRNLFQKDILVDLICYRKHGHNEIDDPTFTQPHMYKLINEKKSVPILYKEKLLVEQPNVKETLEQEASNFRKILDDALSQVLKSEYKIEPRNTYLQGQWSQMTRANYQVITVWNTGCNIELLRQVGMKSVEIPSNFHVHPTVERAHIKKRQERVKQGDQIDWSTAEALAIGSLLTQGYNVRLSGQDVGRGTFSQRHCMLVDQETNETHIPLNSLSPSQTKFLEVCNSPLSEEAVMGFDYGFSMDHPNNLVIWEAQFGDFFTGAQIILDTYVTTGEQKWMRQSGIVLLLPHGYDGAASEHSSCRIERFLQSSSSKEDSVDSDDVNFYMTNPTTPANYFHLLRRQMVTPYRKPLVIASPKLLLRAPECVSSLSEMATGTSFASVIDDPQCKQKDTVKRIIFVFGKHYYALVAERSNRQLNQEVAIVRVEELAPFPAKELRDTLKTYKNAHEFVWAQEEHRNMGAWCFVRPRFENILGIRLNYSGRDVSGVTAVGIGELHQQEVKKIMSEPFKKF